MDGGDVKIKKLPDDVIAKIAAGEVVANPASVVKELLENALDAGASNVEVLARRGGKSYIKVADDGVGMSAEELQLAVQRYTTSKISTMEDIYGLKTYGFRGEALASIADVSRLVITTSNGVESTKIEVVGGKLVRVAPAYRERGTTVEVHDLFFNVPARRKFLSSEKIEGRMIVETVERFVVSKPSIGFVLKLEDDVVYNLKPGVLVERFKVVFPDAKETLELDEVETFGRVDGVISTPEYLRRNRTGQMFFVNGRFVIDGMMNLALERGFGELLQAASGKPFGVVFLTIDPRMVDVNIHPQKLQVKFSDPKAIYEAVTRAVRSSLRKFRTFTIDFNAAVRTEPGGVQVREAGAAAPLNAVREQEHTTTPRGGRGTSGSGSYPLTQLTPFTRTLSSSEVLIVRNRYIVFEEDDGLTIVDFHAAHERVIFEKLRERSFERVDLLLPLEIQVPGSLARVAEEIRTELGESGFEFDIDDGKIVLRTIPSLLSVTVARDVFLDTLEEYRLPFGKPKSLHHVLASKACKAAVKTGDRLSNDEALALISQVREKNLLTCPHGRPIVMKLPFSDLDKFFGR